MEGSSSVSRWKRTSQRRIVVGVKTILWKNLIMNIFGIVKIDPPSKLNMSQGRLVDYTS